LKIEPTLGQTVALKRWWKCCKWMCGKFRLKGLKPRIGSGKKDEYH